MKHDASADTLQFNPHMSGGILMNRSRGRKPHVFSKLALLVNDFLVSASAFAVCALLFYQNGELFQNRYQMLTILVVIIASMASFKWCKLYNYHVIYRPAAHFRLLATAYVWNLLVLSLAWLLYMHASSANDLMFVAVTAGFALLFLLFNKYMGESASHGVTAIGVSFILVGMLSLLEPHSIKLISEAPRFLASGILASAITVSLCRYLMVHQLFGRLLKKSFRRQTVILGADSQARRIASYVIDNNTPFWITGIVGVPSAFDKELAVSKQRLGDLASLPRIVEDNRVSEVIITDDTIEKKALIAILDFCAAHRLNVWFPPSYMPVISVKLHVDNFCGLPMIRLGTQKNGWLFSKLKYTLDALATLPIFVLQLPLFLAISAAIKVTSRGPVFYKATAIGKNGRSFSMYKFRSMRQNSDNGIHKDYVTRLIKGEIKSDGNKVLKITNDDRITPIGRLIRKYSLDELPQLINVLKGDMSLVGPRPCLPYEYEAYEEWHKKRAAIRPGISGLWQVTGRSEVAFDDMILLDIYYLYNRGFSLDLNILLETLFVVINKKGAH